MTRRSTHCGVLSRTVAAALAAGALLGCPAEPQPECPSGSVLDEAADDCVPERCGADRWGLVDRNSSTIHVAPGDDGDGSEERPFSRIRRGIDEAGDAGGGLVVVAAGTYEENLVLGQDHDGVEIVGRCPELVRIDGSGEDAPAIHVDWGEVQIRGLTISGGQIGLLVGNSGIGVQILVELEDVSFEENHGSGLHATRSGATVRAERCTVSRTLPEEGGEVGFGIVVQVGARLIANDVLVERNVGVGLLASSPSTAVELRDVRVRDTQPLSDGSSGTGIDINGGAALTGSGLVLEGNHSSGLLVTDQGTTADLEDVAVRDTQPRPDDTAGWGVVAQEGASLVARGLLLERNSNFGLLADGAGTVVDLEGATIRDTRHRPDGTRGLGVIVVGAARLQGRELLLEGNHAVGLFVEGPGTVVALEASVVRDTRLSPDGLNGVGVAVQGGARLAATGLLLEGNHRGGLLAAHNGTSVDLVDATIRGTSTATNNSTATGLSVQQGASVSATGLVAEDNDGPAAYVLAGGRLFLQDAVLRRNRFAGAVVFDGALHATGGTISGSLPHHSEGGGLGVFVWDWEGWPFLDLDGVTFEDLPGPAVYLRGAGRYVLRASDVTGAGSPPFLPGGVFAADGVGSWLDDGGPQGLGSGLLLEGNSFHDMQGDAVVLDGAGATFGTDPSTGLPNRFSDLVGEALINQRCAGPSDVDVLDGSGVDASCQSPQPMGSLLEFRLWLGETGVVE